MKEFLWPVRVYYEDTDSGGVVYYANYLKFMERARSEWLRSLGYEQDELNEKEGVIFAVRSIQLDYKKPARFNDLLHVTAQVIKQGKASITFFQQITKAHSDGSVLCEGQIKIACLDSKTMRPVPIPETMTFAE